MSYSSRQLHCLNAMGLVAWTHKSQPPMVAQSPLPTATSEVSHKDESAPAAVSSAGAETADAPVELAALTNWLVEQSVARFTYRGQLVNCVGSDQSAVLVVSLQGVSGSDNNAQSPSMPLSADCERLLDLMMRAITVQRSNYRLCAVSSGPPADHNTAAADDNRLVDLLNGTVRVVLLLDPRADAENTDEPLQRSMLAGRAVPLWRIAHPSVLLHTPSLKRHAWERLKAVQEVLSR